MYKRKHPTRIFLWQGLDNMAATDSMKGAIWLIHFYFSTVQAPEHCHIPARDCEWHSVQTSYQTGGEHLEYDNLCGREFRLCKPTSSWGWWAFASECLLETFRVACLIFVFSMVWWMFGPLGVMLLWKYMHAQWQCEGRWGRFFFFFLYQRCYQ